MTAPLTPTQMTEITCARCGCEGVRPFVIGAVFCGKCATDDDMEVAGYVDPAHLRDLKPRWENAIQLTKDCEHSGMIPLYRMR